MNASMRDTLGQPLQHAHTITDSNRYRNPQEGRRLWVSGTYEF